MEERKFFSSSVSRKTFSDGSEFMFSISRNYVKNIDEEWKDIYVEIENWGTKNKIRISLENKEEFDKIIDAIAFLKSELYSPVVRTE